ncbi:MAG: ligase-associated DNA damage response endonuclease PdeM [Bacteroidetes bacterium]|nr:ligase-associated DNA damage response endonuclease PdeM [Bacteroidota bacterium]
MKYKYTEINLAGEDFYLLPQKAIYRPRLKQLIISDLHLGKASHFRKQGIAIPIESHLKDIDKLHFLIDSWKPLSVLILGDLFHSDYNKEWLWFKSLLLQYSQIQFILVEGNHDILKDDNYKVPNLLKAEYLIEEDFIFSHHPLKQNNKINFCGHIHPGIKLFGEAKQSVTLPCFYHNKFQFILPAFGHLTGLYQLEREEYASYYLVLQDKVIKL